MIDEVRLINENPCTPFHFGLFTNEFFCLQSNWKAALFSSKKRKSILLISNQLRQLVSYKLNVMNTVQLSVKFNLQT